MTTPVYVGAGADVTILGAGGGGGGNVPYPAGLAADHWLLLAMQIGAGGGSAPDTPSGWTPLESIAHGTFQSGLYLYWMKATGSESGNLAVHSNAASGGRGKMWAYSGTHATSPVNAVAKVQATYTASGGVATVAAPAVNAGVAECKHLILAHEYNGRTPTLTRTSTTAQTERGGSTTSAQVFLLTDEDLTGTGSVTGRSQNSSISGDFLVFAISLAPVAAAPTVTGNVTLDPVVAAGTMGSSASDLSGGVTLDATVAAGTLGQQPGTCVIPALKNWNGSLATSEVVAWVTFCRLSDAVQVHIAANQAAHAVTANLTVTHAALLPGVWYMAIGFNADGSKRFAVPVQAA